MILNISGRTDIVAFYTPWLLKRIKEGFVDVRNPFYLEKVSRIYFKDVDLIVFCTKNPLPIIPYLKDIEKQVIFQVTITPYQKDIEPNVIDKRKIIEGVREIVKIIGKENVYVRYDPILINEKYMVLYHIKAFEKLCKLLEGYVEHIIVSIVDIYKNVKKNSVFLKLKEFREEDYDLIGKNFKMIGDKYNISIQTCYEQDRFKEYFSSEPCIGKELALKKTGKKYPKWKARDCGCVAMVDIGSYNTCLHLCKYCYANYDEENVYQNNCQHDVNSTMLIGQLMPNDEVIVRKK